MFRFVDAPRSSLRTAAVPLRASVEQGVAARGQLARPLRAQAAALWLALPCAWCCGAEGASVANEPTGPGLTGSVPTTTPSQQQQQQQQQVSSAPPELDAELPSPGSQSPDAASPPPSSAPLVCGEEPAGTDFVASCLACAADDTCAQCLCTDCTPAMEACSRTEGCPEILACARETACAGRDCYCGDASLAACAAGEARGPCRDTFLQAPGGRAPTLGNPSAGPASDRALDIVQCLEDSERCRALCPALEGD
jgi:hypothetical protein